MNKTVAILSEWGADTKGALERMLGDENMYADFVLRYKDTFRLEELERYISEGKTAEAFAVAHDLKGSLGNLGLSPMYDIAAKIVELLRAGKCDEQPLLLARALCDKKRELDRLLED